MALAPPPPLALLGDSPHEGESDPLGFSELARELSRLILGSRGATPFTLGIEASWGMGKSTLMGRLRERIEAEPAVKAVWFNAWTADGNGVLEGLLKTVLNEMDPSVLRRALRNAKLMGWLRVLVSIVAGWLRITSVVDEAWKRVAVDPRGRNELRGLVEQAITDWRDKQTGVPEDALLCVFVDDLDRCTPEGVIEVFEAMKLYMNVEGFVFVVGYDRDIVADLVNQSKGYSDSIRSQDYLEKIIQTTFRIPRSSREQSKALLQESLDASGTSALFGDAEQTLVVDRNAHNPRRIKRFLNGFVLSYGLDAQWREFRPDTLIRVHLLYMHFKPFSDLLERPGIDPVSEFLQYAAARDALRRRGDLAPVREALETLKVTMPPNADHDSLLALLEEEVRVPFNKLVAQDGFTTLIESLARADDWPRLRAQLAQGRESALADDPGRFDGLSVLWVDDNPENNEQYVSELTAAGAYVIASPDIDHVRMVLEHGPVDVLISDIARGGRRDAGFEDLKGLVADGLAPRTLLFFTARVTPGNQAAAGALGAEVYSSPTELFKRLAGAPRGAQPAAA
ncbi:MAG TPA: P-loop NTPase fold protein [Solirubrobacteraceae bacterium]|nr:P-loop NTPase fold protein [Solirubrobacteraceae bacterium]